MRVSHQRNHGERDADGKHHLADDQRLSRVLGEPQHNQCRHQRDHAAGPHRGVDVQQTVHDFRAGVRANRCGAQRRSQQADGEDRADHRAEHLRDRPLCAVDGVRARHAMQRVGGENQHRQIHGAGQQQRPGHIDFRASQLRFD